MYFLNVEVKGLRHQVWFLFVCPVQNRSLAAAPCSTRVAAPHTWKENLLVLLQFLVIPMHVQLVQPSAFDSRK